ncbi:hypothetical protein [Streptomyces sp. NPDC002602]|uniref:hypothetical protein n=1 Tax=Streptomyces sp. NPDC002602 TaxID=3364654 RepID=UPI00369A47E0
MRTGSRAALALTLCCSTAAAALTGCGGATRDGYVAVGAAAPGPERGAGENVPPRGQVELQRLGAPPAAGTSSASTGTPADPPAPQTSGDVGRGSTPPPGGGSAPTPGAGTEPGDPGTPAGSPPGTTEGTGGSGSAGTSGGTGGTGGTGTSGGTGGSGSAGTSGGTGGSGSTGGTGGSGTPRPPTTPPGTPPAPTPTPATPAKLVLGAPTRSAAADRWCENVTVRFTNTGTTAAGSGTITFATHIIGALGVDWATRTTTQPLPTPIAGGTTKARTYTVCVESWRVPLGMHVDTRNVTATWN